MKIKDVIEHADNLFKNKFDIKEKMRWCDEVSSMIDKEYPTYLQKDLDKDSSGNWVCDIPNEYIDKILTDNIITPKENMKTKGFTFFYLTDRTLMLKSTTDYSKITVIYRKPFENIRDISFKSSIDFYGTYFVYSYDPTTVDDDRIIQSDDYINIFEGNNALFENMHILSAETKYEGVGVGYPSRNNLCYAIGTTVTVTCYPEFFTKLGFPAYTKAGGTKVDASAVTKTCNVIRKITDTTIPTIPYDAMYVDYLLAQYCYYSRDYKNYNQHINNFNTRLSDYLKYRQQNADYEDKSKFTGFMKGWRFE